VWIFLFINVKIKQKMNLNSAKVLITGGNSGIGAAVAEILVNAGAKVAIAGRNIEKLETIAEKLGVIAIQADVTNEDLVEQMTTVAHEKLGGLNVLINNAGYGYVAPLVDINPQEFEEVWRTNVYGAMLTAQAAAKIFVAQSYGNIINIASTAALSGGANYSPYNATKFALRGMTESWRGELRPHNIRVMLVNPSEVMTSFAENLLQNTGKKEKNYTENEQATKLRGEEIAHVIKSLLEMDDRGFVTEATVFATNPKV
jgi:3-oxoacyl-[acyl-carrier protein] reductase